MYWERTRVPVSAGEETEVGGCLLFGKQNTIHVRSDRKGNFLNLDNTSTNTLSINNKHHPWRRGREGERELSPQTSMIPVRKAAVVDLTISQTVR